MQAHERGWHGAPCGAVPITAIWAQRPEAAHSSVLKAFLHSCFNRATLGRLFAALTGADVPVVRDWCYTWAPLRQSAPAAALCAALGRLDAAPNAGAGAVRLPVEAVMATALPAQLPRLQGGFATATGALCMWPWCLPVDAQCICGLGVSP